MNPCKGSGSWQASAAVTTRCCKMEIGIELGPVPHTHRSGMPSWDGTGPRRRGRTVSHQILPGTLLQALSGRCYGPNHRGCSREDPWGSVHAAAGSRLLRAEAVTLSTLAGGEKTSRSRFHAPDSFGAKQQKCLPGRRHREEQALCPGPLSAGSVHAEPPAPRPGVTLWPAAWRLPSSEPHAQGEVMGTMVSSSCTSQGHLCATEPQGALGPPKHQVKAAMSSHDHHCFILPRFEPARDVESFSFLFRTATELQKAAPSLPEVRSSAETPHLL